MFGLQQPMALCTHLLACDSSFDIASHVVMLASCVTLSTYHYGASPDFVHVTDALNIVFTGLFAVELVLKACTFALCPLAGSS